MSTLDYTFKIYFTNAFIPALMTSIIEPSILPQFLSPWYIMISAIGDTLIYSMGYLLSAKQWMIPKFSCDNQNLGARSQEINCDYRTNSSALTQWGAKPLSEQMLGYCQLDPWESISVKSQSKFIHFHSRKCVCKCRLGNGGHLVSASMCWSMFSTQ